VKKRIVSLFGFATILIGTSVFPADSFDLGLAFTAFSAGQYQAALDRLRPLVERGNPEAQLLLGHMYEEGLGVNQDSAQAVSWFRKSAEQGHAPAQSALGMMFLKGSGVAQDNTIAASWVRKSAEQGDAPAQFMLGSMYAEGTGVPVDDQQATTWFRKSADQNIAPAQTALGFLYLSGKGVPQDNTEATSWFRRSADLGDARGQYYLGSMYLRGQGVPQDNVEAVRWLRKSADQGDVVGQATLGSLYLTGTALPRNCSDAARWFRKAGEGGHPQYRGFFTAREALGHIFRSYFYYIERYALLLRTVRRIGGTSAGKVLVEEQGDSVRISCGRRGMTVAYPFLDDEVLADVFQGMKSLMADCLGGDKDVQESESEKRILEALLSSLERSYYLSCEEVGLLTSQNEEPPGWIGLEFQVGDSGLLVLESFEGAPASREGIRAGDRIVEVDGRSTEKVSKEEARKILKGTPGTTVTLRILSEGSDKPKTITIMREIFKYQEIMTKNLGDGIGYIRIRSFSSDTDKRLMDSLRDLGGSEGIKGFILDLRGCPGGPLNQIVKISGIFLDAGPVAIVKSRGENQVLTTSGEKVFTFPMVVLCDSKTGSGAEAVTAALKENGRATVIGMPTAGKAFIQSIYILSDGSAVKIGTGMLATSKGITIEGDGVRPDIAVQSGDGEAMIKCGIQVLQEGSIPGGPAACR